MNKVLIVGTGTIGAPLIGFFADFKHKLNIDEIYFHKRTPLKHEKAKVNSLIRRGARLVVDNDSKKISKFESFGHRVTKTLEQTIDECDVIIDCTPAGNDNKNLIYSEYAINTNKIFIAQGSEKGFGVPYAHGINDSILYNNPNYIQVVSCNTHNIASILKTLSPNLDNIITSDFVCIRRANDISQECGFISCPVVDEHSDDIFGTHHARDAHDLLATLDKSVNIFSSSLKLNTQYMHAIRFNIFLDGIYTYDNIIKNFKSNKFIAFTEFKDSARIFSFGREYGHYGRILNQGVIVKQTLRVSCSPTMTNITGFCYTPQDGNSLLSSLAATLYSLHGDDYIHYMKLFYSYLLDEI